MRGRMIGDTILKLLYGYRCRHVGAMVQVLLSGYDAYDQGKRPCWIPAKGAHISRNTASGNGRRVLLLPRLGDGALMGGGGKAGRSYTSLVPIYRRLSRDRMTHLGWSVPVKILRRSREGSCKALALWLMLFVSLDPF